MIADFAKDTLREYAPYLAVGIFFLLAAGALLGSLKRLAISAFTFAFKTGASKNVNQSIVIVAAGIVAVAL